MEPPEARESLGQERARAWKHTDTEWQAIRPIFTELYQHDHLPNVRKVIAEKHGFYAR